MFNRSALHEIPDSPDYERYATTLADLHLVAFACIILKQAAQLAAGP
ncbi:hypothetical protein [Teichococcus aestuarii]